MGSGSSDIMNASARSCSIDLKTRWYSVSSKLTSIAGDNDPRPFGRLSRCRPSRIFPESSRRKVTDGGQFWHRLDQQSHTFSDNFQSRSDSNARDVAARSRDACHKSTAIGSMTIVTVGIVVVAILKSIDERPPLKSSRDAC